MNSYHQHGSVAVSANVGGSDNVAALALADSCKICINNNSSITPPAPKTAPIIAQRLLHTAMHINRHPLHATNTVNGICRHRAPAKPTTTRVRLHGKRHSLSRQRRAMLQAEMSKGLLVTTTASSNSTINNAHRTDISLKHQQPTRRPPAAEMQTQAQGGGLPLSSL